MPYCTKCGKEVNEEDGKCPSCGFTPTRVVYRRPFESVDEGLRNVEDHMERISEASASFAQDSQRWAENASSWARENRRWAGENRFANSVMNGLVVLWLGASLLLREYRYFPGSWWMWFIAGVGLILIGRGAVALATKGSRFKRFLYPGILLLVWGAASILRIGEWWAILLIGLGLAVILGGLRKEF